MESLITKLNSLTKKVTDIKRIEDRKKNMQSIAGWNKRFKVCVRDIESASEFIEYASDAFKYNPSDILLAQLKDSIELAKKMIADNNIGDDSVSNLEEKNKKWNGKYGTLQKEWKDKYNVLNSSVSGLINIVNIVDPQLVSRCKLSIASASSYSSDLNRYKELKKAIDDINELITKLSLDDEIKSFLTKVGKGTAMISDINDKILRWIYANGLASKMKISFTISK